MNIRDSEMRVLEVLWERGEMPASQLYRILEEKIDWKKSTTYTVLKKCIEKGFVAREEPDFICVPLIDKSEIQEAKISDLLTRFFDNSMKVFLNTFIKREYLNEEEIEEIKELVGRLDEEEEKQEEQEEEK